MYWTKRCPAELRNRIYEDALEEDKTAVILSKASDLVGKFQLPRSRENIIITSSNNCNRFCKTSRIEYYPMLEAKVLALEVRKVIVHVVDFDFRTFTRDFLDNLSISVRQDKLADVVWEVQLSFSYDFLLQPRGQAMDAFMRYCRSPSRNFLPLPDLDYVVRSLTKNQETEDGIRNFLNNLVLAGESAEELFTIINAVKKHFGFARLQQFPVKELFTQEGDEYLD